MRTPYNVAIEATGLRKSYGDHVVLDGIDIVVPAGTIFALLGPNGAGKTTAVRILSALAEPDDGTIRVAGADPRTDRADVCAAIGLTGQFSAVDDQLTGRENLRLIAGLRHLPRMSVAPLIDDLLSRFDLVEAADRRVSEYSGGMTRRLDLAMTLVGSPSIIFLDEPTTGLDPRSRRAVWDTVRALVGDGTTVFLTTQYLEEADQLADRIAVLDHGRIVAEGTAAELKRLVPGGHVRLEFADEETFDRARRLFPNAVPDRSARSLAVPGTGDTSTLREILDVMSSASVEAIGMSVQTPDLDDVFLSLTGRNAA